MSTVSVIIPTFRCAPYLREAIESVLAQSYQDLEIIVVDGSPTEHEAVLAPYRAQIQYVCDEGRGVAAARNQGIRHARGEILAFLDGDDRWVPQKVERQVAMFRRDPDVALVFTDGEVLDEHGRVLRESILPKAHASFGAWVAEAANQNGSELVGWLYEILLASNCIPTSSVMVRRGCLVRAGLFNESYPVAEDYELWLRLARLYPLGLIRERLMSYRTRGDGLSGPKSERAYRWKEADARVLKAHLSAVPASLHAMVRARIARCARLAGWYYFWHGNRQRARALFAQSLRYERYQPKAIAYLIATFFPKGLIQTLRMWKTHLSRNAVAETP